MWCHYVAVLRRLLLLVVCRTSLLECGLWLKSAARKCRSVYRSTYVVYKYVIERPKTGKRTVIPNLLAASQSMSRVIGYNPSPGCPHEFGGRVSKRAPKVRRSLSASGFMKPALLVLISSIITTTQLCSLCLIAPLDTQSSSFPWSNVLCPLRPFQGRSRIWW